MSNLANTDPANRSIDPSCLTSDRIKLVLNQRGINLPKGFIKKEVLCDIMNKSNAGENVQSYFDELDSSDEDLHGSGEILDSSSDDTSVEELDSSDEDLNSPNETSDPELPTREESIAAYTSLVPGDPNISYFNIEPEEKLTFEKIPKCIVCSCAPKLSNNQIVIIEDMLKKKRVKPFSISNTSYKTYNFLFSIKEKRKKLIVQSHIPMVEFTAKKQSSKIVVNPDNSEILLTIFQSLKMFAIGENWGTKWHNIFLYADNGDDQIFCSERSIREINREVTESYKDIDINELLKRN